MQEAYMLIASKSRFAQPGERGRESNMATKSKKPAAKKTAAKAKPAAKSKPAAKKPAPKSAKPSAKSVKAAAKAPADDGALAAARSTIERLTGELHASAADGERFQAGHERSGQQARDAQVELDKLRADS